ncbi:MAG TPA: hypothetical protein VJT82_01180 [Pyrinomonadaceae bacterium]|nr:hypothetical protein [Pyrinomonadaceae bacterium]
MRKLPVVQADGAEKQELQRRIAFANRPHLNITQQRLDEISTVLAKSNNNRARFLQDPTGYLKSQSVPVSSCKLTADGMAQTSEVCSVNAVCNVNAFANVNVGTKVNVALAVNAFTIANVVNTVYVYNKVHLWGYEMDMMLEESMVSNENSPYSGGIL